MSTSGTWQKPALHMGHPYVSPGRSHPLLASVSPSIRWEDPNWALGHSGADSVLLFGVLIILSLSFPTCEMGL